MIYKKCIMTINKNNATLDEDIYLFRLDKNIELHFSIVNNRYKFDKSDLNNIIAQTNAAYFQIRLYRSDEIKYTFAIQPTQDGVAVLTITDDLINDPIEVGEYDFQISLLDADKTSMISMPIVKQQLHVCEPLVDNQAIMGRAVLGLSSLASGEIKNAFDSEGNYIREVHNDGDILSAQLVNKFEEALDSNTKAIKNQDIPHTISSKVLATVPASDITIDDDVIINNVSINKDRIYYIEFLGSKKICNFIANKEMGDAILCSIGNYAIQVSLETPNITVYIAKINANDTTVDTFTDLIIHEEEVKYLDSKYLETDLVLQNSISLGRKGDIGVGSSAIGTNVIASGFGSHAEGMSTIASGESSHAEGNGSLASGASSHAEGSYTTASGGFGSHAEGSNTTANGIASHSEGSGTTASSQNQHVQGKYNIEDTNNKYAHIVGNGEDGKNSNAHTLDWQGNGWFAGKLSQEGAPTEDKDLATKKYVDDGINYDNKQINNKIVAMNISKHPVSCSTEIYKKPLCDIFPELLNITYNTVFRDSNSFKVNMDNFAKEYPTVKSAYNKLNINLYDENDNSIGNSYGNSINGDGLNVIFINITESLRFYAYFDKALVDGSSTTMETKNGYMTIQLLISKSDNKQEFIDKIKNLKLTLSVIRTDFLNLNNETIYTPTSDYNPATKKYVDDNVLIEQIPILRIDETNKRIYVNCNNMGTYKKYFVPNKYANVYGFSFIYTNEDKSETEIALIGGAMTRDDFILCARNTDTLFILILGGTDKYKYTKSTKTLEKGLYGYLKIGNTQEYTPTENYHPATKKYVDDKISSLPQLSFNEAGELVVTINGVSKTFVSKPE